MNVEQARHYMIEQQLRTWLVLDPKVLDALERVRREFFVTPDHMDLAFAGLELPLRESPAPGERMMLPQVEGRLLQALDVQFGDKVLEVGTGSGYMAAVMAYMGASVLSFELEVDLARTARRNLQTAGINHVDVRVADGSQGAPAEGPFDIIVLSGSVAFVPRTFFDQLNPGGRLVAVVGEDPAMTAMLYTKPVKETIEQAEQEKTTPPHELRELPLFDTCMARLRNFAEKEAFHF